MLSRTLFLALALSAAIARAAPPPPDSEFFEKKIRPVLAARCYACHSAKSKSPMGNLLLDTRSGTQRVVADGKLLAALRYSDPKLQMPPGGKLPDAVIADFDEWIRAGAADPRTDAAPMAAQGAKPTATPGIDFVKGRQWWSFQPVTESPEPAAGSAAEAKPWRKKKHDAFLLAALEKNGLTPSPEADRRTLIRRVALDLTGIAPSHAETEAYVADSSPQAYENLIERLLASQRYGERWGRYWLDVARYGEDNPTSEATNPAYPQAWRYRDWVVEAINQDVPYDRFVKMQLAADQLPGFRRADLRALGYLGAAPIYHKDHRLSRDVIETLASDDWDERVDAVTRGILGLTVGCARCHDHKFDPISTKDYYALAGVFASLMPIPRPLADIDEETERKVVMGRMRTFYLDYLIKLVKGEPLTVREAEKRIVRFQAELEEVKRSTPEVNGDFAHAVIDAGLWIDGSDTDLTRLDYRPGQARDLPVFQRGNPASPGEIVPRRFLTLFGETPFRRGAGRLDLAESLFAPAVAPLAGRVIVNRVWGWHFGKPLVPTTSDFGTQGEPPSHRELLDDLTARFIANGWSLKWLHREIMLSAAYRQSSRPREEGRAKDPTNRLVWRMNPRRLDFEAWRDSILATAGTLDAKPAGGASAELEDAGNHRRTVYAKVSRSRLNPLLKLYDFPDPNQHTPARELTTTPLQQLFVMNGQFLRGQAAAIAQAAVAASGDIRGRIQFLYRTILARAATPSEIDLGMSYLENAEWADYVQALLGTNEFIFWP